MIKDIFDACTQGPWYTSGLDVQWRIGGSTLYFQQTKGEGDWRYNFRAWVKPYKDMPEPWYVHEGFAELWHSARDDVLDAVSDAPITHIAGFSHGAALGLLAHEDIQFSLGICPVSDLFGCPRVVWMPSRSIHTRFDGVRLHTVHGDLIHHLPPLVTGYQHVGRHYKYGPMYPINPWSHYPQAYRKYLQEAV